MYGWRCGWVSNSAAWQNQNYILVNKYEERLLEHIHLNKTYFQSKSCGSQTTTKNPSPTWHNMDLGMGLNLGNLKFEPYFYQCLKTWVNFVYRTAECFHTYSNYQNLYNITDLICFNTIPSIIPIGLIINLSNGSDSGNCIDSPETCAILLPWPSITFNVKSKCLIRWKKIHYRCISCFK